jgi:hypothetical protein
MVDDHVHRAVERQRVVAGAGLAVDDGQHVEVGGGELLDRREGNLEHVHHGPVLGPPHDPTQGQGGLQAGFVLDQAL